MSISITVFVIVILACVVVGVAAGFTGGFVYRKKVAESAIGSAKLEATRIVNEAVSKAESAKKEKILEAGSYDFYRRFIEKQESGYDAWAFARNYWKRRFTLGISLRQTRKMK